MDLSKFFHAWIFFFFFYACFQGITCKEMIPGGLESFCKHFLSLDRNRCSYQILQQCTMPVPLKAVRTKNQPGNQQKMIVNRN